VSITDHEGTKEGAKGEQDEGLCEDTLTPRIVPRSIVDIHPPHQQFFFSDFFFFLGILLLFLFGIKERAL
jgi:hypothetical protein